MLDLGLRSKNSKEDGCRRREKTPKTGEDESHERGNEGSQRAGTVVEEENVLGNQYRQHISARLAREVDKALKAYH